MPTLLPSPHSSYTDLSDDAQAAEDDEDYDEDGDDAFEDDDDDEDEDEEYDSDGFDESRPNTAITDDTDDKKKNKPKMPSLHFAVLGDKGIGKTSFVLASTDSLAAGMPVPKTCSVQELPVELPNVTVKVTLHDAKPDGENSLSETAMELKNIDGYFVCYSVEVRVGITVVSMKVVYYTEGGGMCGLID